MIKDEKNIVRCSWALSDPLYIAYHDNEWGVAQHDDGKLFELIILEGMQAGLSWITILRKRENYREALDGFNFNKIAKYNEIKKQELLKNEGIIRNKLKIASIIENAKSFITIQKEYKSFDQYIWQFVKNNPIQHKFSKLIDIPPSIKESEEMSDSLRKRGFKFVGPTICYAFMQASGLVNDHVISCYRYKMLNPNNA